MEPVMKAESRAAEANLGQECRCQGQNGRSHMGQTEKVQPTPSPLREFCCGAMFQKECSGIKPSQEISFAIIYILCLKESMHFGSNFANALK
ncbi:hypothetical protein PoB_005658800 [Plakobranchus ocellatus]|uniref:Uncharacterized protein n=1 Tax=Plakobranchus ocellatus TaxID=259542 RepID=A0AAV4CDU0_9GAST|nr:hypothetical protein PoB_005658800 [Plakobranchus ocellatus]